MDYFHYDTVLKFGKHNGKTVKEVMMQNKGGGYLLWAHKKGIIKLSDYLLDKCEDYYHDERVDELCPSDLEF